MQYITQNKLNFIAEYVDDGISGTSFDRPGFNRMIADIEAGKINMVITKDLSRLGRNYVKSGLYIENYCPVMAIKKIQIKMETFMVNAKGMVDLENSKFVRHTISKNI